METATCGVEVWGFPGLDAEDEPEKVSMCVACTSHTGQIARSHNSESRPPLIRKSLHDLNLLQHHNSQSIRYLGSCRMLSIHRNLG